MLDDLLRKVGLSDGEIEVYNYLLTKGESPAGTIIKNGTLKRGTAYNVLKSLITRGLIEQFEKDGVAYFRLEHPAIIEELLSRRALEIDGAKQALRGILPELVSSFNISHIKPSVRYFEGPRGIKAVYDDILEEGKPLLLIRSQHEYREYPEIVKSFIKHRVGKKIPVDAITPDVPNANKDPEKDAAWLLTRRWIPGDDYTAPVEVDIYGDKIAIIVFKDTVSGIIINNPLIATALRQIFTLLKARLPALPPLPAEDTLNESVSG